MPRRKNPSKGDKDKKKKKKSIETGEIIFAFPPKLNELTISKGSPSFVETLRLNSPFLPAEVPLSKHLTPSPAGDPDLWPPPAEQTGPERRQDSAEHHIIMITVICSVTLVVVIACADCFLSITCEAGGAAAAGAAGAGGAAASPVGQPSAT